MTLSCDTYDNMYCVQYNRKSVGKCQDAVEVSPMQYQGPDQNVDMLYYMLMTAVEGRDYSHYHAIHLGVVRHLAHQAYHP